MKKLLPAKFILVHLFFLFATFSVCHLVGFTHLIPNETNLLSWDASWYNSVKQNGYLFSDSTQSNAGFFPLFPFVWRFLGVNALQMCLVNALIALLSVFLIAKTFQLKDKYCLLFLSFPSIIFFYLPYAESLFCLGSALFLIGLKRDKKYWAALGLFLASLSKATALFFIPALVFMLLLSSSFSSFNFKFFIKSFLFYTFFVVLGVTVVVLLQFYETGIWFAYFNAQSIQWSRTLQCPIFPLTTWDESRLLGIDALAFYIGLLALFSAGQNVFYWLKNKANKAPSIDKSNLFSSAFLVLAMFSVLLFNPTEFATETTSIFGINRYMLATPFFLVFFALSLSQSKLNHWQFLLLIAATFVSWFFFYAFYDLSNLLFFIGLTVYIALVLAMMYKQRLGYFWIPIYVLNLVLQVWVYDSFLNRLWIG